MKKVILLLVCFLFISGNVYGSVENPYKKIEEEIFHNKKIVEDYYDTDLRDSFSGDYTQVEGVLTFRGNNFRDSAAYGVIGENPSEIDIIREFKTDSLSWGGGAGWTGQPLIIKWEPEVREIMNIYEEFKRDEDYVEVICASLDGKIYFFDLNSGRPSREYIDIGNPIKGTPSVDPRGYPLLYVGQGIPEKDTIGYRIFNLIDSSLMFFIDGKDEIALRGWGAFDSSPLIDSKNDTMILCGENGILYLLYLNTEFNKEEKKIIINPVLYKRRYFGERVTHQGIESSPCAYKSYVFFADNTGNVSCVNLMDLSLVWMNHNEDDTDATLVLDLDLFTPYLYGGNEVDHQGDFGNVYLRKYDGITGSITKEKVVEAYSIRGNHPVNGGMLGTPVIGKNEISDTVIFQIARYETLNGGLLIALNKDTFEEKWCIESKYYSWSSPVDMYDSKGRGYILNCDSKGNVMLIDGEDGSKITAINLQGNIESSPAVYNDTAVIPSRNGNIYFLQIK